VKEDEQVKTSVEILVLIMMMKTAKIAMRRNNSRIIPQDVLRA
jgi:hypothetical protein